MTGEEWLVVNGLPQVVRPQARLRGLVDRCAPFLLTVLVMQVLAQTATSWLPQEALTTGELDPDSDPQQAAAALLVVVAPVVAVVAGVAAAAVRRRLGVAARTVMGVLVAAAFVVVPLLRSGPAASDLVSQVVMLAVVLALGFLGAGSLVLWAARRSWRELGTLLPMVVWVMPVLMLTVLFLFFNAEIWQVATGIDWPRTWGIAAVLLGLSLVVIVVTASDELRTLSRHPVSETDDDLLAGTPYAGQEIDDDGAVGHLRLGERINLMLLPIASQSAQVVVFSVFMGAFFLAFGRLAITAAVELAWTAHEPVGGPFGFSQSLLRVSTMLGAFCGLSFISSSSRDEGYREAFLDPILTFTRRALAVRAAYRAETHRG